MIFCGSVIWKLVGTEMLLSARGMWTYKYTLPLPQMHSYASVLEQPPRTLNWLVSLSVWFCRPCFSAVLWEYQQLWSCNPSHLFWNRGFQQASQHRRFRVRRVCMFLILQSVTDSDAMLMCVSCMLPPLGDLCCSTVLPFLLIVSFFSISVLRVARSVIVFFSLCSDCSF